LVLGSRQNGLIVKRRRHGPRRCASCLSQKAGGSVQRVFSALAASANWPMQPASAALPSWPVRKIRRWPSAAGLLGQALTDNWLSNRVFADDDDIVGHCCFYWNRLIEQP
jgi:hypothetical protein